MEIIKEKSAVDQIADFIKPYIGVLFPGCIVGCANSKQQFSMAVGTQDGSTPLSVTNIFDIASVTKTALNLVTLKKIPLSELDQKIIDVFPMKGLYRDQITVRHLLSFGVEYGDRVKLSNIGSRAELLQAITNGDLVLLPGSTYRYTNVSSMLLTLFLQAKFGTSFDQFLETELFTPLGMTNTSFNPERSNGSELNIVPTEKKIPRGVIQDESARLIDMPVGSAGLFSNMGDLLTIGQSFLGENTYLPTEVLKHMPISQFTDAPMTFGLGMGLRHQNECDICNPDGSPVTVLKKNGFSGVHFCVLPESDFSFVVFGNICYPKRPSPEGRDNFTLFHKRLLRLMYQHRNELLS